MGGGSPSPAPAVAVPSAADEEAAAERARLYALLRSRRGGTGLLYGARPRLGLLQTRQTAAQQAQTSGGILTLWDFGGQGDDTGGYGGANAGPDAGGYGGEMGGGMADSGG